MLLVVQLKALIIELRSIKSQTRGESKGGCRDLVSSFSEMDGHMCQLVNFKGGIFSSLLQKWAFNFHSVEADGCG